MRVFAGFVFTLAWALYLGGALAMELVWRPVHHDLPPAQTGVMCQRMGRRWRWMALAALGLVAVAWWGGRAGDHGVLGVSPTAGWPVVALVGCWVCLAGLVIAMGVLLHPRSHARWPAGAGPSAHAVARRRRLRAIRVMDMLLRLELVVALSGAALVVLPGGPGVGWAA